MTLFGVGFCRAHPLAPIRRNDCEIDTLSKRMSGMHISFRSRNVSRYSGTDLCVRNQTMTSAKAGTDLKVFNSTIKRAYAGTDAYIVKSNIEKIRAGTDLTCRESTIDTAYAGTDVSLIDSKIKSATAGTSLFIFNSIITGSAESGSEAQVENSTIEQLRCFFGTKSPMKINRSTINELYLGKSKDNVLSNGNVSVVCFTLFGMPFFSYSNANNERNFRILGIPVSKISRHLMKSIHESNGKELKHSDRQTVILIDSTVQKIIFEENGGLVCLKGNSQITSLQGGGVSK